MSFSANALTRVEELLARIDFPDCDCEQVWRPCRCEDCRDNNGHLKGERARKHNDRLAPCACVRRAVASKLPVTGDRDAVQQVLIGLGTFLALAWPKKYAERPRPRSGAEVLRRRDRIQVMQRRFRAGTGLYHPSDLWHKDKELTLRVCVISDGHAANGIGIVSERLVVDDADARPPQSPRWPYAPAPVPVLRLETDRQRLRREREDRVNRLLVLRGAGTKHFDARRPLTTEELAGIYGIEAGRRAA